MMRITGGRRPQNLRYTLHCLGRYLGRHRLLLGLVAVLASASALASLLVTYMIRPVVNGLLEEGTLANLARGVGVTAAVYLVGALCTLGYSQIMVRAAQKILREIRGDLFARLQTLPLQFFDTNRKGDLMSLFTNDVDTVSDALNNSFALVIQTFIQVAGTLVVCSSSTGGSRWWCWWATRPCSGILISAPGAAVSTMRASRAAWANWTPTSRR